MGIALYILISYIIAVLLYTVIVRNNATNKHSPSIRIWDFVKEGMIGMGIGFLITGALIGIIFLAFNYLN